MNKILFGWIVLSVFLFLQIILSVLPLAFFYPQFYYSDLQKKKWRELSIAYCIHSPQEKSDPFLYSTLLITDQYDLKRLQNLFQIKEGSWTTVAGLNRGTIRLEDGHVWEIWLNSPDEIWLTNKENNGLTFHLKLETDAFYKQLLEDGYIYIKKSEPDVKKENIRILL